MRPASTAIAPRSIRPNGDVAVIAASVPLRHIASHIVRLLPSRDDAVGKRAAPAEGPAILRHRRGCSSPDPRGESRWTAPRADVVRAAPCGQLVPGGLAMG